jgi:hypothetical protein
MLLPQRAAHPFAFAHLNDVERLTLSGDFVVFDEAQRGRSSCKGEEHLSSSMHA